MAESFLDANTKRWFMTWQWQSHSWMLILRDIASLHFPILQMVSYDGVKEQLKEEEHANMQISLKKFYSKHLLKQAFWEECQYIVFGSWNRVALQNPHHRIQLLICGILKSECGSVKISKSHRIWLDSQHIPTDCRGSPEQDKRH